MLNGLDLFSGIGGISFALKDWVRPVVYCEFDRYCQGVLLSRMQSGDLSTAPVWDDVRGLSGRMLPDIDIVYGGFPCQDLSVAGRNAGLEGKRSGLFFEIIRLVEETQPAFVFLENVPAIRTRGLRQVVGAFTDVRYDCRWTRISAASVGAPHLRERWFLLAANPKRIQCGNEPGRRSGESREGRTFPGNDGAQGLMADTDCSGQLQQWKQESAAAQFSELERLGRWTLEPDVGRVAHGLSDRAHRLKALGNAVVPAQAREAFRRLMGLP